MKMRTTARALFAAAVLGALGVGATQALAGPQPDTAARRYCLSLQCKKGCVEGGFSNGRCIEGNCECF